MLRLLLTFVVGLALLVVPGTARAAGIAWRPCPRNPAVECGRLRVPIDWSNPRAGTVEIAVARRKAADPERRIGSLLFNLGGPGGEGIAPTIDADQVFSAQLLERFDIAGFDPRGVGQSHPVRCFSTPHVGFAATAADYARRLTDNGRIGRECRRLSGPVFDHADTISVARDLDALRAALGERRISFYGLSYGTLLGQRYAELFPRRLRALVLDSNLDHSIQDPLSFVAARTRALERTFHRFAAWCADSADCALRGRDAVAALDELMARADRGELVDPEFPDFPIDPEFLSRLVAFPVAETRDWQQLGELLARLRGTPLASRARRTDPEPVEDAYHAILCADWRFPIHDFDQLRAYRAALRRIAPHLRVDGHGWDDVFSCQGFPVRVRNPQHRYRIAGTPPILMTNSRLDTSTPHEWAVSVARQVPAPRS